MYIFSGYRTAEGFEGYFMMKRMNAPFILIADPRIEGGAFYLGSENYEQAIRKVIQNALDYLGFEQPINSFWIINGIIWHFITLQN